MNNLIKDQESQTEENGVFSKRMERRNFLQFAGVGVAGVALLAAGCKKDKDPVSDAVIFSAGADITAKMDEFRSQLGVLNTTTGVTGGRRESMVTAFR